MAEPDEPTDGAPDPVAGLPDIVRESDRPIIIYQGYPPNQMDAVASNSMGLLTWLALLSLCLGVIGFCTWRVLDPGHDSAQVSLVYPEGRPKGLSGQVEERKRINAMAEGIVPFLDRLRADNFDERRTRATHPLMSNPGGVDQLRRDWDQMCESIRAGIYERRIGQIEARMSVMRTQRLRQTDTAEAARLDGEYQALLRQRTDLLTARRTDSDPALRCTPAVLAPVCTEKSAEAWCHPDKAQPREFVGKAT
jgi:hypothetical protein